MLTVTQVSEEVLALHAFFQSWFRGAVPKSRTTFARVAEVWADPFSLIDPQNRQYESNRVLEQTFSQHGAFPDLHIEIRNIRVTIARCNAAAVALYEEWHIDFKATEGRLCSATFCLKNNEASLAWLHIHESSILSASPSAA